MPKPEFTVNTDRLDPYKSFRFRVFFGASTDPVAAVSKVSALTRTTQIVTHREGGDPSTPRRSPGQSEYPAITLERGVTHDAAFYLWASKVWNYQNSTTAPASADQLVSLADFRQNIRIVLYNESRQQVIAYNVHRCWVSEFTALPELDANANAVAIQTLKLENEGWDQDFSVQGPTEPTFTLPTGS